MLWSRFWRALPFFLGVFAAVIPAFESSAAVRQSGKIMGQGTSRAKIQLTAPKGGWTIDRMVHVAGEVSDPSIDPITVNINGERYLLRTRNGQFSRKFPVSAGKNSVVVQGVNKAGLSRSERTVFAQVPPVAVSVVLTSDTDGVYTDLHIYEPSPTLKTPFAEDAAPNVHVYWADTASPSGGKFYLNEQGDSYDQPGYGPYLYTHTSPPIGVYRIDANYWPSGDKAHTQATLNLTLFGGTQNEIRRVVKQPLVMPGETVTLAWLRVDKDQKATIYVPSLDRKPADDRIWPKFVWAGKPQPATPDLSVGGYD